ncbi:hypothetical protein HYFRA_00009800 [Hymenoscyphus fraxineus]|uniref:3-beta hydroxysteroid dehydrogenase/isomerase domain-containing protein n=1 Tax=Hymenoscyphus fraxineus TaxID=746836 RepID=A0A9N9L4L4_9HELO|nr:hypothetical protein HYFRA_00009800 [Hymenoscyphus fraxineus]
MSGEIALVTGGCGQVGYFVVKALLSDETYSSVHVFSRNPTHSLQPNVQYHAGSITSESDIAAVISKVKPTVIFHCASPITTGGAKASDFHSVNITGTNILLGLATKNEYTKVLVYTSSITVVQKPYNLAKETQPYFHLTQDARKAFKSQPYPFTKSVADAAVLEANSKSLKTCCLRLSTILGTHDQQTIPPILNAIKGKLGFQNFQIGPNTPKVDILSTHNSAKAHILAAAALLKNKPGVAGEAFFITDGQPVRFWDFIHDVYRLADPKKCPRPEDVWIVPTWLVLFLIALGEWVFLIFTFGYLSPPGLKPYQIRYLTEEATFSIEKARERLGYEPDDDREIRMKEAVEWGLNEMDMKRGVVWKKE